MNHEMEEHCGSCPQDTVDAAPETPRRGGFERFERFEEFEKFERVECPEGGPNNSSNSSNSSNPSNDIEERVRDECRKSCRRNLFVELLKTVAKVAGVILAAMGLSSFGEED